MSQIITNAFSRYWQECLTNQTPVVLDEFVLANVPDLDPDAAINPDSGLPPAGLIVHRHAVDQRGRINNDAVAYTIVMDTTVGDFSFNAMYLINKASGVVGMIVHKGLETKLKTDEATGQTGNSLVKSMLMEYDRAAEATATHVDASTWQIDYAARLRGMDDDLRLQALQFFGPATFYGDGFKLVNESGVYKVQPGVAYVGGLRAELNEVKKINPGAKPVVLWVDIYRAGSLLDAWVNHFTLTLSVPDMVDYLDSNGYQHHVAKVAIINADGSVTDVRRKRTIELTGDVTGKGILEDAQGVTIAVEIKEGSHRHKWGELDQVPATASRWPSYAEVTGKPDLAAALHRHQWSELDQVPAGLGTYAAATTNVATQLREKSGFYNASNAANGMPFGSEWKYYFNAAHGNADGYNAMIGVDFSGSEMGFAAVEKGVFKGWRQLWHSESRRIQAKGPSPMFELHHPGVTAVASYLSADGVFRVGSSDGFGRVVFERMSIDSLGNVFAGGGIYEQNQRVYSPNNQPHYTHNHSAAQGNADVVASGYGQVGSYAFARNMGPNSVGIGGTIAGSLLRPANPSNISNGYQPDVQLPGTWKAMGYSNKNGGEDVWTTLWIRIA